MPRRRVPAVRLASQLQEHCCSCHGCNKDRLGCPKAHPQEDSQDPLKSVLIIAAAVLILLINTLFISETGVPIQCYVPLLFLFSSFVCTHEKMPFTPLDVVEHLVWMMFILCLNQHWVAAFADALFFAAALDWSQALKPTSLFVVTALLLGNNIPAHFPESPRLTLRGFMLSHTAAFSVTLLLSSYKVFAEQRASIAGGILTHVEVAASCFTNYTFADVFFSRAKGTVRGLLSRSWCKLVCLCLFFLVIDMASHIPLGGLMLSAASIAVTFMKAEKDGQGVPLGWHAQLLFVPVYGLVYTTIPYTALPYCSDSVLICYLACYFEKHKPHSTTGSRLPIVFTCVSLVLFTCLIRKLSSPMELGTSYYVVCTCTIGYGSLVIIPYLDIWGGAASGVPATPPPHPASLQVLPEAEPVLSGQDPAPLPQEPEPGTEARKAKKKKPKVKDKEKVKDKTRERTKEEEKEREKELEREKGKQAKLNKKALQAAERDREIKRIQEEVSRREEGEIRRRREMRKAAKVEEEKRSVREKEAEKEKEREYEKEKVKEKEKTPRKKEEPVSKVPKDGKERKEVKDVKREPKISKANVNAPKEVKVLRNPNTNQNAGMGQRDKGVKDMKECRQALPRRMGPPPTTIKPFGVWEHKVSSLRPVVVTPSKEDHAELSPSESSKPLYTCCTDDIRKRIEDYSKNACDVSGTPPVQEGSPTSETKDSTFEAKDGTLEAQDGTLETKDLLDDESTCLPGLLEASMSVFTEFADSKSTPPATANITLYDELQYMGLIGKEEEDGTEDISIDDNISSVTLPTSDTTDGENRGGYEIPADDSRLKGVWGGKLWPDELPKNVQGSNPLAKPFYPRSQQVKHEAQYRKPAPDESVEVPKLVDTINMIALPQPIKILGPNQFVAIGAGLYQVVTSQPPAN